MKILNNDMYLLLIDEEAEIKENTNTFKEGFNGDWFWNSKYNFIQRTGDITEFDFKITAYYPLSKEAKELDLPLLPNPFEETNIEKLADNYAVDTQKVHPADSFIAKQSYMEGYKAAQAKQFSLEDIKKAIEYTRRYNQHSDEWIINEIIQSLSTQQLPNEFIPEYICGEIKCCSCTSNDYCLDKQLKTITNSEGKDELVGVWVFEKQ